MGNSGARGRDDDAFGPRVPLTGPRPRSIGKRPLTVRERLELQADAAEWARLQRRRPRVLSQCPSGVCGFVSCRWNLFLHIDEFTGSVKLTWPGREITEVGQTCSLKIAGLVPKGEMMPLERVGSHMNLTMERTRQIEKSALSKLRRGLEQAPPSPPSQRTKGK